MKIQAEPFSTVGDVSRRLIPATKAETAEGQPQGLPQGQNKDQRVEPQLTSTNDKIFADAIAKANKIMVNHNTRAEFSVHPKTKDIMIKIIDTETNEILKEFPPEKILDMIAKIWELAGLFVDERR